jgi:hypothetical protein
VDSFKWKIKGKWADIVFSLIRNGRTIYANLDTDYTDNEELIGIRFDYLGHENISVSLGDLDITNNDYDQKLWAMLLQVTNITIG